MSENNGDIIGPSSGGDLAVIGEGTPNQTAVSVQVLQSIYHELTGKSEEISKNYSDSFQIQHKDFEQLNHRFEQCCEQYNIKSNNCSVKVYFVDDTQETFSSFERFRAFNSGSSSSVESVLVTYNFLILLPKLNQPQSYSLSIRLASRIAIEKKMDEEMPFHMPKIWRTMGGRTAVVSVKYIDYVVARNILGIVDEWFKTLPRSGTSKLWEAVRKRSDYLPLVTRYTAGLIVSFYIFFALPNYISPTATLLQLAQVTLASGIVIFAAYRLAHHLGSAAEDSLDRWSELSYVCLTAGDSKAIDFAKKKNSGSIWAALLKLIGAFLISPVAKYIVAMVLVA